YESNNTTSTAKTIAVNTDINAIISSSTDKDWFKFTNTTSARNIRIDLTNLPADYDVRLYNPSGTQVAISQNGGTTAEAIIYNTTTTGTWKIQVYGYNGVFNATSCYTVRASISSTAFREDGSLEDADITEEPGLNAALQMLSAFPNPTDGKMNLRFYAEQMGQVQIQVVDVIGRTVMSSSVSTNQGENQTNLDLMNLENGCYHIVISDGSHQATQRVLKQ
ncbi:MAG: T9SS type A sorting domain-containing protein, partial [Flavobacteriales bacterium]